MRNEIGSWWVMVRVMIMGYDWYDPQDVVYYHRGMYDHIVMMVRETNVDIME